MNNEQPIVLETRLKTFTWLGYILIIFAIAYTITIFHSISQNGGHASESFGVGLIALLAAAIFIYFGNKKRKFVFNDDAVEYQTNKTIFRINYADIVAIKTFKEKGRESSNFLILTEDGEEHKLSAAFLGEDLLKKIFSQLNEKCSKIPDFQLEDEIGMSDGTGNTNSI